MSEEKTVFCTQCGSENGAASKFCSNCGAKLEQPANDSTSNVYAEGLFSGNNNNSSYEKITDAEEIKPDSAPMQEEIHINYGQPENVYSTSGSQYYSANEGNGKEEVKGGYIGVSIASLVCGILAILCCCATTFSLLLSIAAITLGIITIVKKYDGKGMAIAGISTGGIAIILTIFAFVSIFATGAYSELIDELLYY